MKLTAVFIFAVVLVSGAMAVRDSERVPNRRGGEESPNKEDEKNWMDLCSCAAGAIKKMKDVLRRYATKVNEESVKKSNRNYRPPALNAVLDEVTDIANECTKRKDCRCPEGYFKTKDGTHCLRISKEEATCKEAADLCKNSMNSRLAVAKNSEKLSLLSDYIADADPTDDSHYWIGLSYNRTQGGIPVWEWEDGTKASYSITKNLNNNVKKSLLTITGLDDENHVFERVAINKRYQGTHYKQETCVDGGSRAVKHKYICEFVMFRVHVKAQSKQDKVGHVQ